MRKNTKLSTPAQLQCLRSRAWEPGNEANISRSSESLASFPGSPGTQICIVGAAWYLLRKHDVMEIGLKKKGNINSIKVLPREAVYQSASIREVLGEVRAAALRSGSGHFHCENWGKFIVYMVGSKLGNFRC